MRIRERDKVWQREREITRRRQSANRIVIISTSFSLFLLSPMCFPLVTMAFEDILRLAKHVKTSISRGRIWLESSHLWWFLAPESFSEPSESWISFFFSFFFNFSPLQLSASLAISPLSPCHPTSNPVIRRHSNDANLLYWYLALCQVEKDMKNRLFGLSLPYQFAVYCLLLSPVFRNKPPICLRFQNHPSAKCPLILTSRWPLPLHRHLHPLLILHHRLSLQNVSFVECRQGGTTLECFPVELVPRFLGELEQA